MNTFIRIAAQLRDLQYTPDVSTATKLLEWLDHRGIETLHTFLERELDDMSHARTFEVSVRYFDRAGTFTPPLYYSVSTLNTVGDLKKLIAEHEHVDPMNVRLMTMEPEHVFTVEGDIEHCAGRIRPLTRNMMSLKHLEIFEVLAFPEDGTLTWDAYTPTRTISVENGSRIRLVGQCNAPSEFEILIFPDTTIGDLKKIILTMTGAPLAEQAFPHQPGNDPVLDSDFASDFGGGLDMHMLIRTVPYMVHGQGARHIVVHVSSSGHDIAKEISEELSPGHPPVVTLWDGPATDPDRRNITDSEAILYELNPNDARIYVEQA